MKGVSQEIKQEKLVNGLGELFSKLKGNWFSNKDIIKTKSTENKTKSDLLSQKKNITFYNLDTFNLIEKEEIKLINTEINQYMKNDISKSSFI